MKRRSFLLGVGALAAGAAAWRYWPDQGFINPCDSAALPPDLAAHPLVAAAWQGIASENVWDCHAHLIGVGDTAGTWINPAMDQLTHPLQYAQKRFFLNAGCAAEPNTDASYVGRMLELRQGGLRRSKLMLLAFDHTYDERGRRFQEASAFHTANDYANSIAKRHPNAFEWIASVHPYRRDALEALEQVARSGARAIKWLPSSMGIDPSSRACKLFYRKLQTLNLPLLSHAGEERAVHGAGRQAFGNPLLLRHALDEGVRVIVAHCASMGESVDLDRGPNAGEISNFALFTRMMDEPQYARSIFGDISAITQSNRAPVAIQKLIERDDWHSRLLNGSDYPLPGVMPLFSLRQLERLGLIAAEYREPLTRIRQHNPLLFDFVLKSSLRSHGKALSANIFETRAFFESRP